MESKQIKVTIPARKMGKFSYPARDDVYTMDESGKWTGLIAGMTVNLQEEDVIDACKRSPEWSSIRSNFFPMHGFHDTGSFDNTPANKSDF